MLNPKSAKKFMILCKHIQSVLHNKGIDGSNPFTMFEIFTSRKFDPNKPIIFEDISYPSVMKYYLSDISLVLDDTKEFEDFVKYFYGIHKSLEKSYKRIKPMVAKTQYDYFEANDVLMDMEEALFNEEFSEHFLDFDWYSDIYSEFMDMYEAGEELEYEQSVRFFKLVEMYLKRKDDCLVRKWLCKCIYKYKDSLLTASYSY